MYATLKQTELHSTRLHLLDTSLDQYWCTPNAHSKPDILDFKLNIGHSSWSLVRAEPSIPCMHCTWFLSCNKLYFQYLEVFCKDLHFVDLLVALRLFIKIVNFMNFFCLPIKSEYKCLIFYLDFPALCNSFCRG